MAKSKSKIPVRRPFSEEKNTRAKEQSNQLELRRISSDLAKHNNRNNDENSVHSLDLNNTNLRVRRFTVTIKDSKGEFVKRRKSYKLTYDQKKDGGDEYQIEKEITSDSFVKLGKEKRVLNDLSNGVSTNDTLNDSILFHKLQVLPPVQIRKQDKSPTNLSVSSNIFQSTEFETSKTVVTDDTSLPVFDDDSSGSNIPLGDTYTLNNSRSLINYSPVSGTTIRLLSPKNHNVTNVPVKSRPRRKVAKVKKADNFASNVQEAVDDNTRTKETDLKIIATPVSKEGTSNSLPPSNFKANLFNRVKKLSTARRPPKFSPLFDENANRKYKHDFAHDKKKKSNGNAKKIRSGITEKTFVKESAGGRIQTDTVESSRILDKKLKRDLGKDNSKMAKNDEEERYESMDLDNTLFILKPKRHRRSVEVGNNSEVANKDTITRLNDQRSQDQKQTQSGLKSNSAILNKPVLKTSVKSGQNTQGYNLLSENHVIESSSNDIFTLEDKKSRLKQAQYITGDLKIVKNKLKDSGFVAQHLDSKMREMIQKKTVLSNLNKSTAPKENDETIRPKPHRDFGQSQTTTDQVVKPYNNKKEPDSANRYEYNSQRSSNVDQGNNKTQNVRSSVKKDLDQKKNIWQVQPKIHRYIPKKIKPVRQKYDSETESEVPYGASTVASWILHSANSDNKKEKPESSLTSSKLMPQSKRQKLNERRKIKQAKRMKRKESVNTLSTTETSPNLINAGMYLPIGMKKLKRRPKRLRPRLYTQVGKVKGYEVSKNTNKDGNIPL